MTETIRETNSGLFGHETVEKSKNMNKGLPLSTSCNPENSKWELE